MVKNLKIQKILPCSSQKQVASLARVIPLDDHHVLFAAVVAVLRTTYFENQKFGIREHSEGD